MTRSAPLGNDEIERWLLAHPTWTREHDHLVRSLETKDYRGAVALLESQVPLVEQLDHHPVATVGYCELRLEVWTHDQAAVTRLDLEYAQGFEELIKRYAHLLS